ncbi:MAG TPA: DUF748 domain-containing protein [Tepidisphaeraceae bacterium]
MPSPARRWFRRVARLAGVLALLVIVAVAVGWFWGRPYMERTVRAKLIALVGQQLNARLDIGRLQYCWPYGVQVTDAAFHSATPGEPSIKLVGFDRLDLQLHRLPLGKGPLVIERIDVHRPTLYVVQNPQGDFIGLEHLFRNADEKKNDSELPPKLSDVLRLRHVRLTDARVEFDDRTISKSVPFVWDKLELNLDGVPRARGDSLFDFKIGAGNGDTARVDGDGSIDLDELVLTLNTLSLTTHMTRGQGNSPLPAGVQRVLNTLGVAGRGRATVSGVIPLLRKRDMKLEGDFVIDDAQGRLSREGKPLNDLDVTGRLAMHGRDVTVDVKVFSCRRGTAGVSIQPATVKYALATHRWTVTPIRAAVVYLPSVTAKGIRQQRATAMINAALTELKERDEFRVNLEGTKLSLPDTAGDLDVSGTVRYDKEGITIEAAKVDGMGGPITLAGVINDTVSAVAGEVTLEGVDLERFSRAIDPDATRTLKGVLNGHLKAAATNDLDAVRGDGYFRITGGTFAKVPILGGLADALKIARNAFTAHEITGRFTVAPGGMNFTRLAVSTDVLSAVGKGDVHFDGMLNLSVYADGHWRRRPKKKELYIPVLSDIGRAIAGAGQYAFGSVSRQFTHFTVTGTVETPELTASPAPVVGESLEKIFKAE